MGRKLVAMLLDTTDSINWRESMGTEFRNLDEVFFFPFSSSWNKGKMSGIAGWSKGKLPYYLSTVALCSTGSSFSVRLRTTCFNSSYGNIHSVRFDSVWVQAVVTLLLF